MPTWFGATERLSWDYPSSPSLGSKTSFTDGNFLNFFAGDAPSLLNHPRQTAVLSVGFVLDFLEHVFRKVE